MPGPPAFLLKAVARQLGGPSGPLGSLIARMLNKGNAATVRAAVGALELGGGERVADIGFGGGVGLGLLLDTVGAAGRVVGVEPSTDMLARARRVHRDPVAGGRLQLEAGTLGELPFGDDSLDGWLTINTFYFVDDLVGAAAELRRVLAPGGRGVVGVGDPDLMAEMPFTQHGFRLRPVADVIDVLTAGGMTVDRNQVSGADGPSYNLLVCRPR